MENLSDKRIIDQNNTGTPEPAIKSGEYYILKTDIGTHYSWRILIPKLASTSPSPNINRLIDIFEVTKSNKLFSIITHYLSKPKCVEKILFFKKENTINIWTAISEYSLEKNRKLVYQQEMELVNFLSKADFHFNFCLIEQEEIDEILSSGAIVIYKRS